MVDNEYLKNLTDKERSDLLNLYIKKLEERAERDEQKRSEQGCISIIMFFVILATLIILRQANII